MFEPTAFILKMEAKRLASNPLLALGWGSASFSSCVLTGGLLFEAASFR